MTPPAGVLLYDGDCGFCKRWIGFARRHDRRGRFRFLPLQDEEGARLLVGCGMAPQRRDTIVLVEPDGRCSVRSTAALRVARGLRLPVRLLYVFMAVPRPLRDGAYSWVARNRHRFRSS